MNYFLAKEFVPESYNEKRIFLMLLLFIFEFCRTLPLYHFTDTLISLIKKPARSPKDCFSFPFLSYFVFSGNFNSFRFAILIYDYPYYANTDRSNKGDKNKANSACLTCQKF